VSEQFICEGQNVFFTNGGGQALVAAMHRCAQSLLQEKKYKAFVDFTGRNAEAGWGCCAFGIDYAELPNEMQSEDEVKALALVLDALVSDLQNQTPKLFADDVTWNPELQNSWLIRVEKMQRAAHINLRQFNATGA
jgi:hypothetical protein